VQFYNFHALNYISNVLSIYELYDSAS